MTCGASCLNGGERGGLDGVAEARREAHRAHHAQLVFAKTQLGLADGAHEASPQILAPANEIEHLAGFADRAAGR